VSSFIAYTKTSEEVLKHLKTSLTGLSKDEVNKRLNFYGANKLPTQKPVTVFAIFFQQFLNPLIYILAIAAIISLSLGDMSDAAFIAAVLLLNAIIGTLQEYSAEKSAQALKKIAKTICLVERDSDIFEVESENLVPGDIVILESGSKVPADLRLISSRGLEVDESLLTGESLTVTKEYRLELTDEVPLGVRKNMLFTGSIITKGRAKGIVVATGLHTELGKIADSISFGEDAPPPLLIRMNRFTKKVAIFLLITTFTMAVILLLKGQSWQEVLMFSVALSVSAIPEGLPVALTIALSIASRKMAKKNVIVRKLPAVEALGSCSFIATDKTGTLTVNQLTIKKIITPEGNNIEVEGSGLSPAGDIKNANEDYLTRLLIPSVLCNEANLISHDNEWKGFGDSVDLAFLVAAHKAKLNPTKLRDQYQLVEEIPFEAENQYAATSHITNGQTLVSVKGAAEKILLMCDKMATYRGDVAIERDAIATQMNHFAEAGYRVLAVASGEGNVDLSNSLNGLTFLGLVGMIDPLRPEAAKAIHECHNAGIQVAMVTGDHPKTAFAIAHELKLAKEAEHVVSGPQLKQASEIDKADLIDHGRVFARVEPHQKLEIVNQLISNNHFVAVTGDGVNDAPALKASNVGVAMGKSGTDIAKESSDLIITDDRFASIVEGIREGRIAYSNVRKVVYLLISTGAAEIVLFFLSILFNTPLPLTAVQVLWLNLVTNGIQDVGLAFEPGEGDELKQPPRKPSEPVFDKLMLERIIISSVVIGILAFTHFHHLVQSGVSDESARNITLLLMVLFENIMIGNCRSEKKSAFKINPFSNKVLLYGTIGAQLIHIAAMYTPGLKDILGVSPVSLMEWSKLLLIASTVLIVMEIHKRIRF
jgi:Ca2+-transporting ATPase